MRRRKTQSICSAIGLATALAACGKKSDKSDKAETPTETPAVTTNTSSAQDTSTATDDAPGVTAATGNDVVIAGQLALSGLELTATEQAAIVYQFSVGDIVGTPSEVAVASDGRFQTKIPKADEIIDFIASQALLPREERDWEQMASAAKSIVNAGQEITADFIKQMPEAELQANIGDLAKSKQQAGRMTLMVAYDKSGDKIAEAKSFRFIGLQTPAGKNLSGLPNGNLKGNVNLGKITGDGADVTSEVKASDALDVSATALESFADLGRVLKSVKNHYMNSKWSVTPFYFWKGNTNGFSNAIDRWTDVSASEYNGYGFYVGSNGAQGLSHADVCGGKAIEFQPPSGSLTLKNADNSNTFRTVTKFTNAGTSAGSDGLCNGGSDYYARRDERGGDVSYMLNFGTGGSIQESPEGLWIMKIDGDEVGHYDLASAMPIDNDRKPLVFIPQARFNTLDGKIVSVDVELYRWTDSAYEKVTDLEPVRRLFKSFEASVTAGPSNTEYRTKINLKDDGTMQGVFDGSRIDNDQVINTPVPVSSISSNGFAVYYEVGSASYRIEFR